MFALSSIGASVTAFLNIRYKLSATFLKHVLESIILQIIFLSTKRSPFWHVHTVSHSRLHCQSYNSVKFITLHPTTLNLLMVTNEINQVETRRTPLEVPEITVTSQMENND